MTLDDYISEMATRRNELLLRLWCVRENPNIPEDAKDEQYRVIGEEAQALRLEIESAIRSYTKQRPS